MISMKKLLDVDWPRVVQLCSSTITDFSKENGGLTLVKSQAELE